jgi:hypothetical protein
MSLRCATTKRKIYREWGQSKKDILNFSFCLLDFFQLVR